MAGQGSQKATLQDTMLRYQRLRRLAHEFAEERFKELAIRLRDITYSDAIEADKWRFEWRDPLKKPSWEWARLYNDYKTNAGAKRFDVALLANGELCALCYGVPTSTKLTLKIHGIARNPVNNPLAGNVLEIMLYTADAYARILKCKEIWLVEPMNEMLTQKYQEFGYTPVKNSAGITTHLRIEVHYA